MILSGYKILFWLILLFVILAALLIFSKRKSFTSTLFSLAAIFLVLAASAQPAIKYVKKANKAVVLLDVSASVSDKQLVSCIGEVQSGELDMRVYDNVEYVMFARTPIEVNVNECNLAEIPEMRTALSGIFADNGREYFDKTNIKSALLYASKLLNGKGDIYIYSDCIETRNSFDFHEFNRVFADIKVHTLLTCDNSSAYVSLEKVETPKIVSSGQNVTSFVKINSNVRCNAILEVEDILNSFSGKYELEIENGINCFDIPISVRGSKCNLIYKLKVDGYEFDKNEKYLAINAFEKPRVTVFTDQENTLEILNQIIGDQARVNNDINDWQSSDLLILQDGINKYMEDRQLTAIRDCVNNGAGLLMFPGKGVFNDALMKNEILKDLLPVNVYQQNQDSMPTMAVVFVFDTSKSMADNRVQIAKEVVRKSVATMSSRDKVGIVEFYGNRRWAIPIQPVSNEFEINRAISRLTASGSTTIYPAILEAYYGLLNEQAVSRHIVIISDGKLEDKNLLPVIDKLSKEKITVSSICVEEMAYVSRMYKLSSHGNGIFYFSKDRFNIPELNFRYSLLDAGISDRRYDERVFMSMPHSIFSEISCDRLKMSYNYYYTEAKPLAQVLLSDAKCPVLSISNYGAGKVAFCSGDMFCFAGDDNQKLLQNVCRQLYKRNSQAVIRSKQIVDELNIYYKPDSYEREGKILPSVELLRGGEIIKKEFMYPGYQSRDEFCARFDDLAPGFYTVIVVDINSKVSTFESSFNLVVEKNYYSLNESLLYAGNIASGNKSLKTETVEFFELWQVLIIMSLVVFLINIINRRRNSIFQLILISLLLGSAGYASRADLSNQLTQRDESVVFDSEKLIPEFLNGYYDAGLKELGNKISDDKHIKCLHAIVNYQCDNYAAALEQFYHLLAVEPDYHFEKMVFAWMMLAAEKDGSTSEVLDKLLANEEMTKRYLELIVTSLGFNNDFERIVDLYYKQKMEPFLETYQEEFLTKRLMSICSIAGSDLVFKHHKEGVSGDFEPIVLAKIALFEGDRLEAERILNKSILITEESSSLLRLSDTALEYSLYSVVENAAKKVQQLYPDLFIRAEYLLIESAIAQNKKDVVLELIDHLYQAQETGLVQITKLAKIYSRIGEYDLALKLYNEDYKLTGDIKSLVSAALTYEEIGDLESAFSNWYMIWQLSDIQSNNGAGAKLLDIARSTGKLAELAADLEEKLYIKKDENVLYLLLTLYQRVEDSLSARALIEQYFGGDSLESLKVKHQAYLMCRDFKLCENVLFELIEADQANKEKYIRDLGVLASQRKDIVGIKWAIEQLFPKESEGYTSNMKNADLASFLGDYDLSFELLQKELELKPDSGEILLSWANAAIVSNNKELAIERVVNVINSKPDLALLVYAIDSLLNLDAEDTYYSEALNVIFEYIGHEPGNMMLYYLALDVIDQLEAYDKVPNVIISALAFSPDRSFQLVRHARRYKKLSDDFKLDLAKYLLYSNCVISNEDYNDICFDLFENDAINGARYILHTVLSDSIDENLLNSVADFYHRNSLTEDYKLIIQKGLMFLPKNYDLLRKLASIYLSKADYINAREVYYKIYHQISESVLKDSSLPSLSSMSLEYRYALNGLILSSEDNCEDMLKGMEKEISTLAADFDNLDIREQYLLLQSVRDYLYICLQLADTAKFNYLCDSIKGGSYSISKTLAGFLDNMQSSLPVISVRNEDNTGLEDILQRLSDYILSKSEIEDLLVKLCINESDDVLFRAANSFLSALQNNEYVDSVLIKHFYNLIWSRLSLENKRALADMLSSIGSYANNHYIILAKIDVGIYESYPYDLFLRAKDQAFDPAFFLHCVIMRSTDSDKVKVIKEYFNFQNNSQFETLFKLISLFDPSEIVELCPCFEEIIENIHLDTAKVKNVSQYIAYFSLLEKHKVLLLSLLDKMISDYPEDDLFYIFRLKYFPELYDGDSFYSNIVGLIDIVAIDGVSDINSSVKIFELLRMLSYDQLTLLADNYKNKINGPERKSEAGYIYSNILFMLENYPESLNASYNCFIEHPENMIYKRDFVTKHEYVGAFGRIAATLTDETVLRANVSWRDIIGYFCQSGDLESANKAVKNEFGQLRVFDNMYISYLFSNSDKAKMYFREIFESYSATNFSVTWPNWHRSFGLYEWLSDKEFHWPFEKKLVYKVSDCKELSDEFYRFWKTVPYDSIYLSTYAQAFARSLVRSDSAGSVLALIKQKYEMKSITNKDYELVFALYCHMGEGLNDYRELIDNALSVIQDTEVDPFVIANAYYKHSEYEKAIIVMQRLLITNVVEKNKNTLLDMTYRSLSYLTDIHKYSDRRIHVSIDIVDCLRRISPNDELLDAFSIKLWMLAGDMDKVESLVLKYVNDDKPVNIGEQRLIEELLRYCLVEDRQQLFIKVYSDCLTMLNKRDWSATLDYSYLFEKSASSELQKYTDDIVDSIKDKIKSENLNKNIAIRHLSLLSVSVFEVIPEAAKLYLDNCLELLSEPLINDLWLADAYFLCGEKEKAIEVEGRLYRENRLPYRRRVDYEKEFNSNIK